MQNENILLNFANRRGNVNVCEMLFSVQNSKNKILNKRKIFTFHFVYVKTLTYQKCIVVEMVNHMQ